jgi:very-short-patch-repair endonuclease
MRHEPTRAENRVWQWRRDRRLGFKFRRQVPIGPFIVDFYCAELKLVIEMDGRHHDYAREYDDARTMELYLHGIRVFRIPNDALRDSAMVVEQIKWMIRECARPPHPPAAPSPPYGGGEGP